MLKSFRPKYVRHDFSWFFFTTSKILTYYVAKDESSLAISFIRHLWNCKQMRKVKWKNLELIQVLKNQNISNIWDKKASRHPHKLCGIKIIITKGSKAWRAKYCESPRRTVSFAQPKKYLLVFLRKSKYFKHLIKKGQDIPINKERPGIICINLFICWRREAKHALIVESPKRIFWFHRKKQFRFF